MHVKNGEKSYDSIGILLSPWRIPPTNDVLQRNTLASGPTKKNRFEEKEKMNSQFEKYGKIK